MISQLRNITQKRSFFTPWGRGTATRPSERCVPQITLVSASARATVKTLHIERVDTFDALANELDAPFKSLFVVNHWGKAPEKKESIASRDSSAMLTFKLLNEEGKRMEILIVYSLKRLCSKLLSYYKPWTRSNVRATCFECHPNVTYSCLTANFRHAT